MVRTEKGVKGGGLGRRGHILETKTVPAAAVEIGSVFGEAREERYLFFVHVSRTTKGYYSYSQGNFLSFFFPDPE